MRGQNMNLAFGLEVIYDDAEFQIGEKDKVGIVGVNGAGKTTLFRLLLKEIELDSGTLNIGNARVGYLPQEIVIEDDTLYVSVSEKISHILEKINSFYKIFLKFLVQSVWYSLKLLCK